MSDFRSVCRRQMELVIIMPHSDKRMNGYAMYLVIGSKIMEIRIIPYPPSFNRMAARIMDPAIGASTWAFGSHKWTPYSGILIMKAIIHASHRMLLAHVWFIGVWFSDMRMKFNVPIEFWMKMRAISSGMDPMRV